MGVRSRNRKREEGEENGEESCPSWFSLELLILRNHCPSSEDNSTLIEKVIFNEIIKNTIFMVEKYYGKFVK